MDPGLYLVTDGACKNKTTHAAGSGFLIYNLTDVGPNKPREIQDYHFMFKLDTFEIQKIEYEVLNKNLPAGKYPIRLIRKEPNVRVYEIQDYIVFNIYVTGKYKPNTNNRAEYLAYILGSIILDITRPNEPYTLVSDSALLLNTLKEWMPNWIKKGIVQTKENPDLLYEMIKSNKPNRYVHINSHLTPAQFQRLTPTDKEYSKLNDIADELANEAINIVQYH